MVPVFIQHLDCAYLYYIPTLHFYIGNLLTTYIFILKISLLMKSKYIVQLFQEFCVLFTTILNSYQQVSDIYKYH